jgi:hypothetical protein
VSAPLIRNPFNIAKSKDFHFRSKEDKKLSEEIDADVQDMEEYARPARERGKDAIQGYMALSFDGANQNDGRSRLFPPVIHATVYARMSMEAANTPKVEFKHRKSSSEPKMRWINAALRNSEAGDGNLRAPASHLWFQQNFDKILFGTGGRYQSYLLQTRVVHVKDENGKWKEKTMIVYDDIWDEVLDFFHWGVSRDMAIGMFEGRACYFDKFYPYDVFMERFDTPFYENVQRVNPNIWFRGDSDYDWDIPKDFVVVRHYFDVYKDLYYVKANGIPIRKDHILDYGDPNRPKKMLPISTLHNDVSYGVSDSFTPGSTHAGRVYATMADGQGNTQRSFWTMGDPYLVRGLVGLKRSLWRAASDYIKASSIHFLLAKTAGVFDQVRTADLYGIVPIKSEGDSFSVQSLTQGSTFLNQWQGMDDNIDQLMVYALGNDWKRAAAELTNEKATVAAIRQQVQRLRMAQNMKFNETGPLVRHYTIRLNLIQQYYPEPSEVALDGEHVPEGTLEENVLRDADGHPYAIKKLKEISVDENIVEIKRGGKFVLVGADHPKAENLESARVFKAREEYLRTEEEPEIYIEPGSTFAEMKALQRSLFNETLATMQPFFGLVYPDEKGQPKPLISREGAEYILEKAAEVNEWDPDKFLNRSEESSEEQEAEDMPPPFGYEETAPMQTGMPQNVLPTQPTGPASVGLGGAIGALRTV